MIAAVLLAGLLLGATFLLWNSVERSRADRRQQVFGAAAERVVTNLTDRMAAYEMVLRSLKGYYEGSDHIDQREFHAFVEALRLPRGRAGLQAIALLASVHPSQAAQHEADVRANGLPGYRLLAPAGSAMQAPLTHIAPVQAQARLELGRDAMEQPAQRESLARARDTGVMALSGPLEDAAEDVSLAMYLPLYARTMPHPSVAERRGSIEGWAVARFRMADVVDGLTDERDADIALAIHDGPSVAGGVNIFASHADYAPHAVNGGMESVRSMDVGGRRWTLVLYPLPVFDQRFADSSHHLVALLGVAVSLLAGWLMGQQITARRRAMALAHEMTGELRRTRDDLEGTLNAVPDQLLELDESGRIHHYRSARSELAEGSARTLLGHTLQQVLPPQAANECMTALGEAAEQGYSDGRQFSLPTQDGQRWFELSVARKEGGAAGAQRFIVLARDVTRRHEAEAATYRLAYFDALTGLPNRRLLLQRIDTALQQARQAGGMGCLFFIDLDNFKQINDASGHGAGDSLLVQAARRLHAAAAPEDLVARLGGDEFVMLVPRLEGDPAAARQQARSLAQRLRESLDAPYEVDGAHYASTGSIGVTLFPRDAERVEDLLREADTAMFHAKTQGRNLVCFFEQDMHAAAQARLALEQDLQSAVAADALMTYAQPQVDAAGRLTGAELLLRWNHPRRGFVTPAQFIPVAEESGLICRIGARVISQACATLAELQRRGRALSISVNVSPRQFLQADFVQQVRQTLADTGAPARWLTLEVTENLLVENWEDTARRMRELGALGVRFSIDDFGTGYSSLAYLKRLPLYELKIDKSFVQDTPGNADDAAIVQVILSVARHLRLRVVAEGVETQEQADFLAARDCDGLQGYLYGRPEPLQDWLARAINS